MSTETIIGISALGLTALGGGWALHRRSIRAAEWKGEVNADRASFKEFMREIRDKIDKIFDRLPPVVAIGRSPVRLTELGQTISKEIEAPAWAGRIAAAVEDRVKGCEAYDIQDFSFSFVDGELQYSPDERRAIRKCAYEHGVSEEQVHRVLGIELRDKLLTLASLDPP